jgi:hypothetical protein
MLDIVMPAIVDVSRRRRDRAWTADFNRLRTLSLVLSPVVLIAELFHLLETRHPKDSDEPEGPSVVVVRGCQKGTHEVR